MMGEGLIYDIAESSIITEPIEIPSHWRRLAAVDIGISHDTAVVWTAYDAVCEYTSRDVGERFDKIASISYFQLFGFVLFPKVHLDSIRAFTREDVLK